MSDKNSNLPQHVGLILDGNRRWAKERGLKPMKGHEEGVEVLKTIARYAFDKGVKTVSVFIFSTENWKRSKDEVSFLMDLILKLFKRELNEFIKEGYKIVVLGSRDGVSKKILNAIDVTEEKTKNNTKGTLAICFNYSTNIELEDLVKKVAADAQNGKDIVSYKDYLYHPEVNDIDLLIRTSGENRLSGFMLPRANYAEIIFNDVYWPAYTKELLDLDFKEYSARQRRFGN